MKASMFLIFALSCVAAAPARADQEIASVQQALKDQGFYYGEVTGTEDADTTAAIRRYQIRNGLKITGDLSPETQKSLGVHGSGSAAATPAPARSPQRNAPVSPPPAVPQPTVPPSGDISDLRGDDIAPGPPAGASRGPGFAPGGPQPGYIPGPHGLYPATNGVFDGTPFEVAPSQVQRQVVLGVQSRLAQQGYYRSAIDGSFGAGTASALRTFQVRFRLQPTGRLDLETLAALGLLPGQRAPGIEGSRRRTYRLPRVLPGPGERVYIPR